MELLAVNEPNSLAPVSNWTAANNGVSSESLAALKKALKAAEAAQTKSK